MTELEIGLVVTTGVLVIALVCVLMKLAMMFERVSKLSYSNDKLKNAVRQQKALNDELHLRLNQPTEQNLTLLNHTIFRQRETIDELKLQIAQQKRLLSQKWKNAQFG